MSDLSELYQEVILDHYKTPRNFRRLDGSDRMAVGHNPLCGDQVVVYLKIEGTIVKDISFQGSGCAISTASASLMTEALKGKTLEEIETLFKEFHTLLTTETAADPARLGKLAVFSGVREFPARVKCATLPWHTLHAALENKKDPITTE